MDGLAYIDGIAAHLDGQTDFADHVASARPDDSAADHAVRFGVKDELGEPILGAVGDGAS